MKHQAEMAPRGLVSTREAAAFLTLSMRTLMTLAHTGKLAFIRVSARRIAFAQADLDTYIAQQRR